MKKDKGMSRDTAFGVLSILFAVGMMLGFSVGAVVELVSAGTVAGIVPALTELGLGLLGGVSWITAGAKSLKKVGTYKKFVRVLENTPRFRLPALANAMKKDVVSVQSDLSRMLKTGYFKGAVINTESKELVFDPDSEMLPVPDGEADTIYKPHKKFPFFPVFMGLSTGAVFAFGTPMGIIGGGIAGVIAFLLNYKRFPVTVYYTEAIKAAPKVKPQKLTTKTGNGELDEALPEIYNHNADLLRLSYILTAPKIKQPLSEVLRLLEAIINHVKENPHKVKQLRQFMNYYLPTTVKLLQSYEELSKQRDKGENIKSSMLKIENMMEKIVTVYKREYDDLYNEKAMDISAEISVLQNMIEEM